MTLDMNRAASRMVTAVRDWSLGYGQGSGTGGRWDIRDGGAADCSSLVAWALNQAGLDPQLATDTYTGNLRPRLVERGWSQLPASTTPQLGDVLLWEGHHTAMCVGTDTLAEAWINESGTTTGGTPGDQTGQETRLANASTHPYRSQWTHLLRPPASATTAATTTSGKDDIDMATLDELTTATRRSQSVLVGTPRKDGGQDYWHINLLDGTYRHIPNMAQVKWLQTLGIKLYERQAPGVLGNMKRVDA